MKTKTLFGASLMAVMVLASAPSWADPSVLCSMRGAVYKPGVDVRGRAVAPADLPAAASGMGQTMRIPLTVDLATRMNQVLPDGVKLEAGVGLVEITPAGRVMIGGRDLSAPTDAMCAALERDRAAAMKTPERKRGERAPASASTSAPVSAPAVAAPVAPKAEQPAVKAAPAPAVAKPEPVAAPKVDEKKEEEKPQPQVLNPDPAPETVSEPVVEPPSAEILAPAAETLPQPTVMDDGFGSPEAMTEPAHLLRDSTPEPVMEEGLLPRPPMDVLSAPQAESVPAPAPVPAPDDLLSGGE